MPRTSILAQSPSATAARATPAPAAPTASSASPGAAAREAELEKDLAAERQRSAALGTEFAALAKKFDGREKRLATLSDAAQASAFAAKDADARTKALERRLAASSAALDKKAAELAKVRETVDDLDVFRLDAVAHQLKKLVNGPTD